MTEELNEAEVSAEMTDQEYLKWRLNAKLQGLELLPAAEAWKGRREKFGGR